MLNLRPREEFVNLGTLTFPRLVSVLIQIALVVTGVVFLFMLIIGGVRWILSGGDKAAVEAARGQVTAALVGLVIVFVTWAIINLIEVIFKIRILDLTIPTL